MCEISKEDKEGKILVNSCTRKLDTWIGVDKYRWTISSCVGGWRVDSAGQDVLK